MPVRTLFIALVIALLGAGTAAAAPGDSLPPVCAKGCTAAAAGSGPLFVFTGHGWGHGVGMAQWGAWGYATHGWTYQQILQHYYPGTSIGAAQTNIVRVLLADRKKTLKISCTVPFTVTDGNGVTHTLPAGPTTLSSASLPWPSPLTFNAGAGGWLTLARPYRGQILVDVVDGRLRAVNVVALEQYLYGVVPAEMPSTWPAAALQAQAVAARSYALATRKVAAPYDLYADTRSQMYLGVSHETPATTAAVDATRGQVVMFGGKVATTYFYSSSGGETESISDAWGVPSVPYLVAVPDPFDVLSPYHDWGPLPVSAKTFGKALKITVPILDLQTTLNPSGRVGRVVLVTAPSLRTTSATSAPGSLGAGTVSGALGLRSTWFSIAMLALQQPAPAAPIPYGSTITLTGTIRGVDGVSLEQREAGGTWHLVGPVAPATDGTVVLPESPALTTDYRLATPYTAVGYVRVRVMPVVDIAAPTPGQVAGTETPALPGAAVDVQTENPDLTWTTVATGTVADDGSFIVPVTLPADVTYRVVVTPAAGYAPGATAPQVAPS
ncbi:MAG TPA: SpoIID/LytB domain-containing protein [Gaiellaceae bacterium]|nr:SpoIID/LytB domain-containing protein [Gaiellaceae bacterium]